MTTKQSICIALIIWAILSLGCIASAHAQYSADSTHYTMNGKSYDVHIGSRGGHYIIKQDGTKYYPSNPAAGLSAPAGATTIEYNGQTYNIQTGPKGGRYIIVNGTKKYIKTS